MGHHVENYGEGMPLHLTLADDHQVALSVLQRRDGAHLRQAVPANLRNQEKSPSSVEHNGALEYHARHIHLITW